MGTPASPTAADRAETLKLARDIVDAVRNDEPNPLDGLTVNVAEHDAEYIKGWLSRVENATFRLAQDLVDTREALEQACRALETEGLEETAHRLRALDLEVR